MAGCEARSKAGSRLFRVARAIELEDARSAGAIGFMAREFVKVGLPHREPADSFFVRRNGDLTFSIAAHPDSGLPYGRYPRLLLAWATTEAVRTKSPALQLGPTLSGFMAQLGLIPAGGPWGPIRRLRDQMMRLFSSTIAYTYDRRVARHGLPPRPPYSSLVESSESRPGGRLEIDPRAQRRVLRERRRPARADRLRAVTALRSPLALDIYVWLTYRMSYLRRPTLIPWETLAVQFGAEYGRTRDFKQAFLRHARSVLTLYPAARLEALPLALRLKPSPPHVAKPPKR